MRRFLLALSALAAGCSFTPQSGQFACGPADACPAGFLCVDELCVSEESSVDAGATDTGATDTGATDTSVTDGNVPDVLDGGPDAGASPCGADFCANFDDIEFVDDGWSVAEVESLGVVTLEEVSDAPSPPAVFQTSIMSPEPLTFRAARLSFQRTREGYDERTPALALSFRFRVASISNDAEPMAICGIRYGDDERYVSVTLAAAPTGGVEIGTETFASPTATRLVDLGNVPRREWQTLRIVIPTRVQPDDSPVSGGVSFALNESRVSATLPEVQLTSDLRFDVGLGAVGMGSAVVEIDDVEIDYLPEE